MNLQRNLQFRVILTKNGIDFWKIFGFFWIIFNFSSHFWVKIFKKQDILSKLWLVYQLPVTDLSCIKSKIRHYISCLSIKSVHHKKHYQIALKKEIDSNTMHDLLYNISMQHLPEAFQLHHCWEADYSSICSTCVKQNFAICNNVITPYNELFMILISFIHREINSVDSLNKE